MMTRLATSMRALRCGFVREVPYAQMLHRGVLAATIAVTALVSSLIFPSLAQDAPSLLEEMSTEDRAAWEEQQEWLAQQREEHLQQLETSRRSLSDTVNELRDARGEAPLAIDDGVSAQEQPATPPGEKTSIAAHDQDLIREIQTGLRDAGCYADDINGLWGDLSIAAVKRFAEHGDVVLPDEPSKIMLVVVNALRPRGEICPLVCSVIQEVRDGQCVKKTCPAGEQLLRDGRCVSAGAQVVEAMPERLRKIELNREIQTLLWDAGCYTYAVDGDWGPRSKRAAKLFAEHARVTLPDEPSQDMLAILNANKPQGRVCPAPQPVQKTVPVRHGSSCTMGTSRLPERDCHFWHSMMQEDRHKGIRGGPAEARYNCQCR